MAIIQGLLIFDTTESYEHTRSLLLKHIPNENFYNEKRLMIEIPFDKYQPEMRELLWQLFFLAPIYEIVSVSTDGGFSAEVWDHNSEDKHSEIPDLHIWAKNNIEGIEKPDMEKYLYNGQLNSQYHQDVAVYQQNVIREFFDEYFL